MVILKTDIGTNGNFLLEAGLTILAFAMPLIKRKYLNLIISAEVK